MPVHGSKSVPIAASFIASILFCLAAAPGVPAGAYEAIGKYEASSTSARPRLAAVDPSLQARYEAAVADAAVAEWSEVSTSLTAIVPQTVGLTWDNDATTSRVLLVTWTAWTGYDSLVGTTTTLTRDMWMTVVPQIKEFRAASSLEGSSLTLRLEQLMGLPPGNGKTRFVEAWADPNDLFRPSADPEITDHEATPEAPRSTRYVTISPAHAAWMNALIASSYGANGYPWTRLGYTFDWGSDATKVGLSEFVIPAGAVIKIHSVTLNDDYRFPPPNQAKTWRAYR
jgi:hypothetical protein